MKEGITGWEDFYANATLEGVDPHEAVHQHLQSIYNGECVPPFSEGEIARAEDFTVEELRDALEKGKKKKACRMSS